MLSRPRLAKVINMDETIVMLLLVVLYLVATTR
jgi:hypothetical protein